jgi:hypothetical protein
MVNDDKPEDAARDEADDDGGGEGGSDDSGDGVGDITDDDEDGVDAEEAIANNQTAAAATTGMQKRGLRGLGVPARTRSASKSKASLMRTATVGLASITRAEEAKT